MASEICRYFCKVDRGCYRIPGLDQIPSHNGSAPRPSFREPFIDQKFGEGITARCRATFKHPFKREWRAHLPQQRQCIGFAGIPLAIAAEGIDYIGITVISPSTNGNARKL